jgi:hypothetical protein
VTQVLNDWPDRLHGMGFFPTNQKGSYVMDCHSFFNNSGKPMDCDGARYKEYLGQNILGIQNVNGFNESVELKITSTIIISGSDYRKSVRAGYSTNDPAIVDLNILSQVTGGLVKNESGHMVVVICDGKKVNGDFTDRVIVDTEIVFTPDEGSLGVFSKKAETDPNLQISLQMEELMNEYSDIYSRESGVKMGDFINIEWYLKNKWRYNSVQRKYIEAALQFANENTYKFQDQATQCTNWEALNAALSGGNSPMMVNGINFEGNVGQLVPKNTDVKQGQWGKVKNNFGLDVLVGDIPDQYLLPGSSIVTKSHIMTLQDKMQGPDGKMYYLIFEANRLNDGKVTHEVLAGKEALKQYAGGILNVIPNE